MNVQCISITKVTKLFVLEPFCLILSDFVR